jgi:DNA-binding MarR family transcriptional regulator
MNNRYEILKRLIDSFDEYDNAGSGGGELTFEGFIEFVSHPQGTSMGLQRKVGGDSHPEVARRGETKETSIAILVTYLYRYSKLYTKKALQGSDIQSPDEFSFLIILLTHDSLSKTELINKNVHEKTTGMEIIKRLVRTGLIAQFDNDADKRSQRVAITDKGRYAIFSVLDKMEAVSKIVSGNLSELEKHTLKHLLEKLDHFHYDIFLNERQSDLADLITSRIENEPGTA